MIEIKTKEDLHKVNEEAGNDSLVIVKFGAQWCGPCRQIESTIKRIEGEYENVRFCLVDIDECDSGLVDQFNIMSVPLTIFFKNGFQVDSILGNILERDFRNKISENIVK